MATSVLYSLARRTRAALERAETASVHDGHVVLFGAAPMPDDATIHGSFIDWSIDGVWIHAVTEPVGADIDADTLLELVRAAQVLRLLRPMVGTWMLRHDVTDGRTQITAIGATAHAIVASAPASANVIRAGDGIHIAHYVDDDLIITASSSIGVAYA